MSNGLEFLTSGRTLARSAFWNFAGMAAPLVIGIVAIPALINGMGEERFGLLAIIWVGVGYFSLFDLGLGRALTKLVAERLGSGKTEDLGPLIWTAITLLFLLSVGGAIVVSLLAVPLVERVLNVEPRLQEEAITSFRILASGLPLVVVSAALIGLLEAHQRFGAISAVRIPLGVLTFAGPLITLQWTPSLVWATGALVLSRGGALAASFTITRRIQPELKSPTRPRSGHMSQLLHFGGWLTVTNVVGPVMTYLDRFLIGSILTMSAVTYYATPYEVLSRLQILPQAIMGVLFPAMSAAAGAGHERVVALYSRSSRVIVLLMLPLTSGIFLLAPEALSIWLGAEFRTAATPVVQWLALGWMINTLARPAFTVLQSSGRPDLVAKAHLVELVPYLLAVWFLTHAFGIVGTAAAWSIRVFVDTAILNELAQWTLPDLRRATARVRVLGLSLIVAFGAAWFIGPLVLRIMVVIAVATVSGVLLWPTVAQLRRSPETSRAVV